MNITVNGYNIHYTEQGSGTPILLLHGWGSSTAVWQPIMNAFCNNFRLIALDFPGCGKSPEPEKPMQLEDYTGLVAAFVQALELKNLIIMGHSNGGRVTLHLLGSGLVTAQKAVLLDSAGLKPPQSPLKTLRLAAFKAAKFFLTLPGLKNHTQQALQSVRSYFGSADYNSASPVMRQTLVQLIHTDATPLLSKISCPTLLIWGENDTATPLKDAKKMEKLIPDAGLCTFKGCGHFAFLERPQDTNAILNSFLTHN